VLLVVDANILISAILKKSVAQNLLFNSFLELYSPVFLLSEIEEHRAELKEKMHCDEKTFHDALRFVLTRVKLVDEKQYSENMDIATALSPDADDVPYVALALTLNCPLWTRDKELLKSSGVKTLDTNALAGFLGLI